MKHECFSETLQNLMRVHCLAELSSKDIAEKNEVARGTKLHVKELAKVFLSFLEAHSKRFLKFLLLVKNI
jgi:hypothetical protein